MQILSNPFPDLETQKTDPIKNTKSSNEIQFKDKNRKCVKNINLLSFVDELEDGEDSLVPVSESKSCHDFENEGLESYQPLVTSFEPVTGEVASCVVTGEVASCVATGDSSQLQSEASLVEDQNKTNSHTETLFIEKSQLNKNKLKDSSVQPNKPLTKVHRIITNCYPQIMTKIITFAV